MKTDLIFGTLAGISMLAAAGGAAAGRYELLVNSNDPTHGVVRMILDSPLSPDTQLFSRQLGSLAPSIIPRCEETGEALPLTDATWTVPAGCQVVSWAIGFEVATGPSIDVSEQRNLFHPSGWWLFTEWGQLLRPGQYQANWEICTTLEQAEICRPVPSVNEPPLFMLVGTPVASENLDGKKFRLFVGHLPDDFDVEGLFATYRQQLAYLNSLTAEQGAAALRQGDIDVLLLGIDAIHGAVGGAAGSSAFLSNVAVSDGEVDASERVRLLWISGHELAHMLGLGTGTLWASESLAHYYGFKSLGKDEAAAQLFDSMVDDAQGMGLLEAHRRVTQDGEGQYYGLFYSRGAAFWKEMDELISAGGGDRDLDSFLEVLLTHDFGAEGQLPPEFIDSVKSFVDPKDLDRVLEEYL